MRRSVTAAAAAASLWTTGAAAQGSSGTTCVDGLYMLVARGTTEEAGTGVTGLIARRIADRIEDSEVVGLDYPATFNDPFYTESVENGTEAMRAAVRSYSENCPDGKLAVFGYSQGAQLTSNTFCGGSGGTFDDEAALPTSLVEDHVIAIILFGDPSHRANATYNEGTSKEDGVFERSNITVCEEYDFIQSYCDTGDVYCDAGDDRAVHGTYVQKYGQDVVEYVLKQWNDATNGDVDEDAGPAFTVPGGNSTTTPTGTEGTATETATTTATETETGTGTETTAAPTETDVEEVGGGDEDAAMGLSAAGSLFVGAPLMLVALWNVL